MAVLARADRNGFPEVSNMVENSRSIGGGAARGLLVGLFHAVCGLLLLWTIPTQFVSLRIARSDISTGGAWVAVFVLGLVPFLVAMALLGMGVGVVGAVLPSRVLRGLVSALIFGLVLVLMAISAQVSPDNVFSIATGIPMMFDGPLPIGLTAIVAAISFGSAGITRA